MSELEKKEHEFQLFSRPENLKQFLDDYDLLLDIDGEQCRCLIENLKKEDMMLGADAEDGKLKVCCDNGASITEITIDDAIDIACDVAYEKILETNQKMAAEMSSEDKIKVLEDAVARLKESALLDKLYVQTIYFKQSVAVSYGISEHNKEKNINGLANPVIRNNKKRR